MSETLPAGHYQSRLRAWNQNSTGYPVRQANLKGYYDVYTLTGAESSPCYIHFEGISTSQMIVAMAVDFDALGTDALISVGTLNDPDAYTSSRSAASAGNMFLGFKTGLSMDIAGVRLTNSDVLAITGTSTAWTAGAKIHLMAIVMEA